MEHSRPQTEPNTHFPVASNTRQGGRWMEENGQTAGQWLSLVLLNSVVCPVLSPSSNRTFVPWRAGTVPTAGGDLSTGRKGGSSQEHWCVPWTRCCKSACGPVGTAAGPGLQVHSVTIKNTVTASLIITNLNISSNHTSFREQKEQKAKIKKKKPPNSASSTNGKVSS